MDKRQSKGSTSISRREFIGGVAVAATAPLIAGAARPSKKPNVVYLFADEHRYQSMSFTETPAVKTPNMARMAREGASFTHAISNNPVCTPHRAMLLTGQWCYSNGLVENNGTLAPWQKTIAHAFNDAGYTTGYTGKWHIGSIPQLAGFDWHQHYKSTDVHWDSLATDLHGTGKTTKRKGYNATAMTNEALSFIEDNAAKPFMLTVSWNPPHAVFTDPPEDKKALYPSSEKLPWRTNAAEATKEKWWTKYQGYHAHISAIDEEIGRVLAKLKALGIDDKTIVVYSADHGSMMNSHGRGNKRNPQEESIRVPFLVRHPGAIKAGQVRDELFGTIDIFPTLCGLAGIKIPAACQGDDFSPNLHGERGPDPSSQLIMHVGRKPRKATSKNDADFFRGVRGKRFTYTVNGDGPWQLFDNEADPYQLKNLIDDPAYADERKRLRGELDRWIAKAEDPYLHDDYLAMPLEERIRKQGAFHSKGPKSLEFLSRLKLSPAQERQIEAITLSVYDKTGRPLVKGGRSAWDNAAALHRDKIKAILTPDQSAKFDELKELEEKAIT